MTKTTTNTQPLPIHTPQKTFITAYGPKLKQQIFFEGQGRTKQSFKDECDINTIMAQYVKTGVLPSAYDPNSGQFLDATGYEYQAAMELVASANSMFHNLPSAVRSRFENDPAKFLNFVENPDNASALAAMGVRREQPPNEGGSITPAPGAAPAPNQQAPEASGTVSDKAQTAKP